MFNEMKQDQDPMKRLSSMMQIVLENTDNAIHKPTPPPSPKRPLKHTKLLNPFAAFTGNARKKTTAITMAAATTSTTTSGTVPVPVATSEPGRYFPSPPGSPPESSNTRKRNSVGSVGSSTTSPPGSPPESNNTRKRNSVGSSTSSTSGMNNSTNTRGSSKPNNIHSNKVYITNETDHPTTTTTNSTSTTTTNINPFPQLPTGRTKEAPRKKSTHLVLIHPDKDILTG